MRNKEESLTAMSVRLTQLILKGKVNVSICYMFDF